MLVLCINNSPFWLLPGSPFPWSFGYNGLLDRFYNCNIITTRQLTSSLMGKQAWSYLMFPYFSFSLLFLWLHFCYFIFHLPCIWILEHNRNPFLDLFSVYTCYPGDFMEIHDFITYMLIIPVYISHTRLLPWVTGIYVQLSSLWPHLLVYELS